MHLTELMQADWVISSWNINEFENIILWSQQYSAQSFCPDSSSFWLKSQASCRITEKQHILLIKPFQNRLQLWQREFNTIYKQPLTNNSWTRVRVKTPLVTWLCSEKRFCLLRQQYFVTFYVKVGFNNSNNNNNNNLIFILRKIHANMIKCALHEITLSTLTSYLK